MVFPVKSLNMILVSNRVWFFLSSLELGMFSEGAILPSKSISFNIAFIEQWSQLEN